MGRGKKVASDQIDPAARATLDQRMEEARADLGLRWRDVADAAGITTEGLRGVRNGPSGIPAFTRRQIERALKWSHGEVDRILDAATTSPAATPQWSATQRAKWRTMTPAEIIAEGKSIEAKYGVEWRIAYLEAAHHERAKRTAEDSASSKDSQP